MQPLIFANGSGLLTNTTYTSYWACVSDAMAANASGIASPMASQIPAVDSRISSFAQSLEQTLSCNGIC